MEVDPKYLAGVRKRLDRLFETAPVEPFDAAGDRLIIFSDHHRGTGDGADDFRHCEGAYAAALAFYLESGYRLVLLGDAEELWEVTRPAAIFDHYGAVMELERAFATRGRLVRFWGNHDDRWSHPKAVAGELAERIGGAPMREGLRLQATRAGGEPISIFLAHGHQGTPESDRFSQLARLPVRFIWPLVQRWQGATATTPAHDHALRARHDRAMFEWARERPGRILIAGHTHRPVFAGSTPDPPRTRPVHELEAALADARRSPDGSGAPEAAVLAAELEYARTLDRRPEVVTTVSPPCYFNTGCCSFPDGDVTGIEIAEGEIRLVRWPASLSDLRDGGAGIDPGRRILARERLEAIFDAVTRPAAGAAIRQEPVTAGV
jgi:UDP-2,3-diacylglucosamine pyrophosphatase LpxH